MNCIVVDLGGTHLRTGIVSDNDELIVQERTRLYASPSARGDWVWGYILGQIARFVSEHSVNIGCRAPIVVAFPGPVLDDRAVGQAPTVVGTRDVPDLVGQLHALTGRDVMMLNDVSAAAWYFEGRLRADRFAVVTVSSGIGSKIFDRRYGPGVMDDVPYAGEIGHIVVDTAADAMTCDCGGQGHLGATASGRGFERTARREAGRDEIGFRASSCVRLFGATPLSLNNEAHLVPAILDGDAWANTLLCASIAPLAEVLRILTIGCGLQGVAIMGGFVQQLRVVYARELRVALALSDRGPASVVQENFVTVVEAGVEPGLLGAARYARHRLAT